MTNLHPIGDNAVSPWIDSVGDFVLWNKIDSDPTLADETDFIYYSTSSAVDVDLDLDVTPLSVVPTDAMLRFRTGSGVTTVTMTAASLRDADGAVIAAYAGAAVPINGVGLLHEVTLALQPGAFNLAAASLVVSFNWPGGLAAISIHALDVVVSGERRPAIGGFFLSLCGFP